MRLLALDAGPDIPITRGMIVVGRDLTCDARLQSVYVSRVHCCLARVGGDLVVRDLGSTHGVRINGDRVRTGWLRAGDELTIANLRYKLDGERGPELTRTAAVGLDHPEDDDHSTRRATGLQDWRGARRNSTPA
jgi:pSer/pThr/pTyr-binding forkhead associated (FHA) protein